MTAIRRTKIIATLGPATDEPGVLESIINAGANVMRLNFSHDSLDTQERRVKEIRETAEKMGREIGIIGDLQGPKIRIKRFTEGHVILCEGEEIILDPNHPGEAGTPHIVSTTYKKLAEDVKAGDVLLLDDGQIMFNVERVEIPRVICKVVIGGKLSDNKGINRQGGGLSAEALTKKDRLDIEFAAKLGIDYLAVSFPRAASDIEEAKQLFQDAGGKGRIIAKIERSEAVANIDEIVDAAAVVMVARGDLGVEIGYAELTGVQKRVVRLTRKKNKIAITATQMMESMIRNPVPTRAEVSDVANAVMDGSDAVMLSGETAVGSHPAKAIAAMARVCLGAEAHQLASTRSRHRIDSYFQRTDEAIAMAVMYTANHLDVKAIIALTESGSTALWMSRIRSDIPIFAFTRHVETRRRVTLYRGVYPVRFDIALNESAAVFLDVSRKLLSLGAVEAGDLVIYTEGEHMGVAGGTNAMKILQVQDDC